MSDRSIRAAIDAGASTVEEVGQVCKAGTGCGACHESIHEMLCERSADTRCSRLSLKVLSPYLQIAGDPA